MVLIVENVLLVIRAVDVDKELNVLFVYYIVELFIYKYFVIDFSIGVIYIVLSLDYEEISIFYFIV